MGTQVVLALLRCKHQFKMNGDKGTQVVFAPLESLSRDARGRKWCWYTIGNLAHVRPHDGDAGGVGALLLLLLLFLWLWLWLQLLSSVFRA